MDFTSDQKDLPKAFTIVLYAPPLRSRIHLPQDCLGIAHVTMVTLGSHGLAPPPLPRGAGKARRGAPGARLAEVWTVSPHLPRAAAPGISPRVHN